MKKQTAVDWYENRLIELDIDFGGHKNYWIERKKIRDQAKAMEKEQNEYFFNCGRQYQLTGEGTFKQVHNETYGGQDETL